MARSYLRQRTKTFEPAAVGSDETKALFSMRIGDRVRSMTLVPIRAAAGSTSSTITIGDDTGATEYFNSAYDPEAAAVDGTPIDADGTGIAAGGGKLYTAADTIDIIYTANGATGALPKCRVTIEYTRLGKS
jgi:hypothetical protein